MTAVTYRLLDARQRNWIAQIIAIFPYSYAVSCFFLSLSLLSRCVLDCCFLANSNRANSCWFNGSLSGWFRCMQLCGRQCLGPNEKIHRNIGTTWTSRIHFTHIQRFTWSIQFDMERWIDSTTRGNSIVVSTINGKPIKKKITLTDFTYSKWPQW